MVSTVNFTQNPANDPSRHAPDAPAWPPYGADGAGLYARNEARQWERHGRTGANVHQYERVASVAAGATLVAWGIKERTPLALGLAALGGALLVRGVSGRCMMYKALGIDTTGQRDPIRDQIGAACDATEVSASITIDKPAAELYEMWRDPKAMNQILAECAEVQEGEMGRMKWTIRGPMGWKYEWETQLIEQREGERLRWASLPGAACRNEGSIRFQAAPNETGTEVNLLLRFDPPGGWLGAAAMKLMPSVPQAALTTMLQRFKSLAETGEVPTLRNNPSARAETAA